MCFLEMIKLGSIVQCDAKRAILGFSDLAARMFD